MCRQQSKNFNNLAPQWLLFAGFEEMRGLTFEVSSTLGSRCHAADDHSGQLHICSGPSGKKLPDGRISVRVGQMVYTGYPVTKPT
jgi:hypothetical protein